MNYNVILKRGAKEVLNFWVACYSAAESAIYQHLRNARSNQATILDADKGVLRLYFWLGDKVNVSVI